MSWSVIGIFVLLVTWGFTKSLLFGAILLFTCASVQVLLLFTRNHRRVAQKNRGAEQVSHQQFLSDELKRLQGLRNAGLLTEDEFTLQNRLLSCKSQNSYSSPESPKYI